MPGELKCPVCGKIFIAQDNQVYCSKQCRKRAYRRRFKNRGRKLYETRICVICGKEYIPRTDKQQTCGNQCTKVYLLQAYGRGKPQSIEKERYERQSLILYGQAFQMNEKYRKREYVETSKAFLDCLQPNAGSQDTRIDLANKAIEAARQIDGIIPEWRKWELPRQAALLDIAVGFGALRLTGRRDIYNALHNGKWDEFKSLVLQSAWAAANGKRAVRMCRQLVCGWWL